MIQGPSKSYDVSLAGSVPVMVSDHSLAISSDVGAKQDSVRDMLSAVLPLVPVAALPVHLLQTL